MSMPELQPEDRKAKIMPINYEASITDEADDLCNQKRGYSWRILRCVI